MKFKINNREWSIVETSEKYLIEVLSKNSEEKIIFANGLTDFQNLRICINENLHIDQKRQTLMHELMHCYIRSFIFMPQFDDVSEETICDISANSHDIIHKIVEGYFNKKR